MKDMNKGNTYKGWRPWDDPNDQNAIKKGYRRAFGIQNPNYKPLYGL
jgi:hypothetical protein